MTERRNVLLAKAAIVVAGIGAAILIVSAFVGALTYAVRTENDRKAMIAANMGRCTDAWRLYENSNGVSAGVVRSFCSKEREDG